jgi:hypothetical protein
MFDFGGCMRSYTARLRVGAVWFIISTVLAFAGPGDIAECKPAASELEVRTALDIPSQPLEDALYAFGAATGIEIIVDGSALTGQRSSGVRGTLSAAQALRILLNGTGLDAHPIGHSAITLAPIRQERSSAMIYRGYSAMLQNAVLRRLCGERDTEFGTYRVAMQVWLNEIGGVERVELLSSTGDQVRDRRIRELLQGISVVKPPAMMPQPVVMVILPRSVTDSGDCTVDSARRPSLDIGGDRREQNR